MILPDNREVPDFVGPQRPRSHMAQVLGGEDIPLPMSSYQSADLAATAPADATAVRVPVAVPRIRPGNKPRPARTLES